MESLTIQRIKLLIEREKETPNSFAKKIGVAANSVYNLLDGGQPRRGTIAKILAAYPNVTESWLMGGDAVQVDASERMELDRLRQENKRLWALVESLSGQLNSAGKAATNFLKALTKAGVPMYGKQVFMLSTGAQVGAQRA